MPTLSHLMQAPIPVPAIDSPSGLLFFAAGAAVSVFLYWLVSRKKTNTETDVSHQKLALDVSQALAGWIEKVENLNVRVNGLLEKTGELQRAFDDCKEQRDDCWEILRQIDQLFVALEATLKDLVEHGHLLEDLSALQRRVQRLTGHGTQEPSGEIKKVD